MEREVDSIRRPFLPLGILKGWKKNSTNSAHAFNPLWGAAVSSLFAIDPWNAYYLYALDDAQENLIPCLLGIRSIVKSHVLLMVDKGCIGSEKETASLIHFKILLNYDYSITACTHAINKD
ncbi:hypothetical protein CDAR_314711 [Caerostris darwini]|uniref:Uncharacterized protein n=1 Tax=Caerostris darwini TaxID=1538125 RepID=A0AAV4TV46_9ARAC|nr:hypothetical protein CDAR_314711 [Caerostris darwini]